VVIDILKGKNIEMMDLTMNIIGIVAYGMPEITMRQWNIIEYLIKSVAPNKEGGWLYENVRLCI